MNQTNKIPHNIGVYIRFSQDGCPCWITAAEEMPTINENITSFIMDFQIFINQANLRKGWIYVRLTLQKKEIQNI